MHQMRAVIFHKKHGTIMRRKPDAEYLSLIPLKLRHHILCRFAEGCPEIFLIHIDTAVGAVYERFMPDSGTADKCSA